MSAGDVTPTRVEAVVELLEGEGVAHEVVEHDATYTAADEAKVTHTAPGEVAKTVVLHDGAAYLLAVVPASERLDIHKLRDVLGAGGGLRLATEEEMAREFPQFELGAVPPVGSMPVAEVVDERLTQTDRVLFAAGDHSHAVLVDPREIVRVTSARVADICEEP